MDGLHVSASGGYGAAAQRIQDYGLRAAQVFLGSPRSLKQARVPTREEEAAFLDLRDEGVSVIAHAPYLCVITNDPDDPRTERALERIKGDLHVAGLLGIGSLVLHPGSMTSEAHEQNALSAVRSLEPAIRISGVRLLLENSASLRAAHSDINMLADLTDRSGVAGAGICIDTAHAYAAGYDWDDDLVDEGYRGLVQAIHFNNSVHAKGSGRDGHRTLGEGVLGQVELASQYRTLRDLHPSIPFIIEGGSLDDVRLLEGLNPALVAS